jgi:hypothetical protein
MQANFLLVCYFTGEAPAPAAAADNVAYCNIRSLSSATFLCMRVMPFAGDAGALAAAAGAAARDPSQPVWNGRSLFTTAATLI